LWFLARLQQARSILELGTLGAYSTIWLARALTDGGGVVTVELNPAYAEVAVANVERAGLAGVVEQRVGPAIEVLARLSSAGEGPFDLIFIDADKKSTPEYFTAALALSRPGTLLVTDNVVRGGALIDAHTDDEGALGMRRFHELLADEAHVTATTIQTVGAKGYDGFTVAQVMQA
jgi:predicted O-methyltransferase YrrM